MDNFIEACENTMIDFAEDLGQDLFLDNCAMEGVNRDIAKMVKAEEITEAKNLIKDAKKLRRGKKYDEAISKLKKSKSLIMKMKNKVDAMPEPEKGGGKILAYFTPIFSLMPSAKITGFSTSAVMTADTIILVPVVTQTVYMDKLSEKSDNPVKKNLQYKFNLFIHNLNQTIKMYEKEKERYMKRQEKKEARKNK